MPFAMLGIALGYIVPPKALDSIAGLLIPVAIFGSGEIPIPNPSYLQDAIVLSPFFHYDQLLRFFAGLDNNYDDQLWLHVAWLIFLWNFSQLTSQIGISEKCCHSIKTLAD
jgi:hypothetical protein